MRFIARLLHHLVSEVAHAAAPLPSQPGPQPAVSTSREYQSRFGLKTQPLGIVGDFGFPTITGLLSAKITDDVSNHVGRNSRQKLAELLRSVGVATHQRAIGISHP